MNEQAKIEEAKYFLGLLPDLLNDREKFIFNLSACLPAGRSALQYARKEAEGKRRGLRWYDKHVARSKIVSFLKDERDLNIHVKPVSPSARLNVHAGDSVSSSESILIAVIRADGTLEKHAITEQQSGGLNLSKLTLSVEYRFQGWVGNEDVVTLCRMYLKDIEAMVGDGLKKGFLTT